MGRHTGRQVQDGAWELGAEVPASGIGTQYTCVRQGGGMREEVGAFRVPTVMTVKAVTERHGATPGGGWNFSPAECFDPAHGGAVGAESRFWIRRPPTRAATARHSREGKHLQ
ncbi:hemolysin activator HlyB [Streptomyces azureus]|uniref:Hemolysin activator HlyB n=1 Tax=Streptomyces azureus TaxID=146537 RepID=A0A0K8PKU1_STRAJ|nr:hemolysin activator HlyB [Streptomyces azureus]